MSSATPELAPETDSRREALISMSTHTLPFLKASGGEVCSSVRRRIPRRAGSERWDMVRLGRKASTESFHRFASDAEYWPAPCTAPPPWQIPACCLSAKMGQRFADSLRRIPQFVGPHGFTRIVGDAWIGFAASQAAAWWQSSKYTAADDRQLRRGSDRPMWPPPWSIVSSKSGDGRPAASSHIRWSPGWWTWRTTIGLHRARSGVARDALAGEMAGEAGTTADWLTVLAWGIAVEFLVGAGGLMRSSMDVRCAVISGRDDDHE